MAEGDPQRGVAEKGGVLLLQNTCDTFLDLYLNRNGDQFAHSMQVEASVPS